MYIVTWYSKKSGGLCEWETRERAEAEELVSVLLAQGMMAALDAETDPPDPFFPGFTLPRAA